MYQSTGIAKSLTATTAEGCDNGARNPPAGTPGETAEPFGVFWFGRQPLLDMGNTAGGVLSYSDHVNAARSGHVAGVNTEGGAKNDIGGVCIDVHCAFSQCVAETQRPQVKAACVKRQRVIDGRGDGAVGKENDKASISKRLTGESTASPKCKYNRLSLKSRVRRDGSPYSAGASLRAPLETPSSVSTRPEEAISKPPVQTPGNTDGAARDANTPAVPTPEPTTPSQTTYVYEDTRHGEAISKPAVQTPGNTDGAARDANTPAVPTPEPPTPFQTSYVYEDISDADEGALEIPHNVQHTHNKQNTDFFDPLNNALNALAAVSDDAGDESLTPEQIRTQFHHLVTITCGLPSTADDACALNTLTLAAEELMADISTQSAYSAARELVQLCNTDIEQCVNTDVETDSPAYGTCAAEEGLCEDGQGTSTQDLVRDTIHWQTPTSAPANTQPVSIPQPQNTSHPDIIIIHSDDESEGGTRPSVIKLNTRRVALPNAEKYCEADDENNTPKTRSPIDVVPPQPIECALTRPKKHKNNSSGFAGAARRHTPSPRVGGTAREYTPTAPAPCAHACAKRKSTSRDDNTPEAKYRRMMVAGKRVLRRCAGLAKTPENAGIFEHYEACFDRALEREAEFTEALETARDQPWRPVAPGTQWYQTPLNPPSSGGLTHFVQIGGPAGRMVRVVEDGERPSTSAGAGISGTGRAEHRDGQHPA